jgi:hypothetical protein
LQASAADDEDEVTLALVDDTDRTVVEEVDDDIALLEDTLEDENVEVANVCCVVSLTSSTELNCELKPYDKLTEHDLRLMLKQKTTPKKQTKK